MLQMPGCLRRPINACYFCKLVLDTEAGTRRCRAPCVTESCFDVILHVRRVPVRLLRRSAVQSGQGPLAGAGRGRGTFVAQLEDRRQQSDKRGMEGKTGDSRSPAAVGIWLVSAG